MEAVFMLNDRGEAKGGAEVAVAPCPWGLRVLKASLPHNKTSVLKMACVMAEFFEAQEVLVTPFSFNRLLKANTILAIRFASLNNSKEYLM